MPALPSSLIEPIWAQCCALLPPRQVDQRLGCHRPRIPDRVVLDTRVPVLVFGRASWRIADATCSATTLRRRRDAWIAAGVKPKLQGIELAADDRMIGLELADVAVDGWITKAPCGGELAGRSPVDRGKQGTRRSPVVDANGIPLGAIAARAGAATVVSMFSAKMATTAAGNEMVPVMNSAAATATAPATPAASGPLVVMIACRFQPSVSTPATEPKTISDWAAAVCTIDPVWV